MNTRGIKRNYKEKPQFFATAAQEKPRPRKPRKQHEDLIKSVQYAALKMLNHSRQTGSVKRHTIEISKASAAYLKSTYNITGRFRVSNDLLFKIVKQRLFERGGFGKIEDGTFKLRMFKRKAIQYFVDNLEQPTVVIGPFCLSIQFTVGKPIKVISANSSLSTLEDWTPLQQRQNV
jgi:hypothetical protein